MSGRCRTQDKRDLILRSSGCHRGVRHEIDPRHSGAHKLSLKLPEKLSCSVGDSHTRRIRTGRADLYDEAGGTGLQAGSLGQEKAIYRFGMGNIPLFSFPVPPRRNARVSTSYIAPDCPSSACLRQRWGGLAWRGGRKEGGRRCEAATGVPNNQPTKPTISTITSTKEKFKNLENIRSTQLISICCGDTVRPRRARPLGPYRHCRDCICTCMCEASYTRRGGVRATGGLIGVEATLPPGRGSISFCFSHTTA